MLTGQRDFVDSKRTARWRFACPRCRSALPLDRELARCLGCQGQYPLIDGIWRFLPPDRLEAFDAFLSDCRRIRRAEGRGSNDPAYYRRLPFCAGNEPFAWQWRIRAQTFKDFALKIVPPSFDPAHVLDLGAGSGWLSHRLAEMGHFPMAVDLSVDQLDGLGAAQHFKPQWPRVQAEFDGLPLVDESADMAVFNASFHYTVDPLRTLREAQRVLRPGGRIVLLDSPIYRDADSGERMLEEQRDDFQKRFGARGDSLAILGFLTWDRLDEWGRELNLKWEKRVPWYGVKWSLAPWLARLRGKREPARFAVLHAQV